MHTEGKSLKRKIASVTCALVVVSALSFVGSSPFGADVVSAASETTTPAPKAPVVAPKAPVVAPKAPVAVPKAPVVAPKAPVTPKTATAPEAVATKTSTKVARLLRFNSIGSDIKFLQEKLNEFGSMLKIDGIFGKLTLKAVKNFQRNNGLMVDGLVGPKTMGKLNPVVSEPETPVTPPAAPAPVTPPVDVVTTASIVNNAEAFEKGISKDGKWIIATLNDLTFTKELVLEGVLKNGKKNADGTDAIQRKIAPYTQDDKKVVLERFTITAPKLSIMSPNARIQSGTFKGDLYVYVADFQLVDAKVEGNVYFMTKQALDSFKMDAKSSITGKQELVVADVVTTASLVSTVEAFEKGIAKDGKWIISTLNDLTFTKELVLEGVLKNGKKNADGTDAIQRKIALYTQDVNKVVLDRFTLTAPKLSIKSPNARIQSGTFKGDIYVYVADFQLVDADVEGNIYFLTQQAKDTFKMDDKSSITGKQELIIADVVTTASLVNTGEGFEKGISKDGKWIIATFNDLTFTKELVLEGEFKNGKKDANGNDIIQRKIAPYTQDVNKVVLDRFTIKAPKLTIKSPNARIQSGTFKGDLYVSAANFQLVDAIVEGNVYFTTQEAKETFSMDAKSAVTGAQELKN